MGHGNDGKSGNKNNDNMPVEGFSGGFKPTKELLAKDLEKYGNPEAKILGYAYEEFVKDGVLTVGELKKLKKIDGALESVELNLACSKFAMVTQENDFEEIDFMYFNDSRKSTPPNNKPKGKGTKTK